MSLLPTLPSAPVLASGVAPELDLVTAVAAIALLALAGWFAVISHDVATSFRRFTALDARADRAARANRTDGSDVAERAARSTRERVEVRP